MRLKDSARPAISSFPRTGTPGASMLPLLISSAATESLRTGLTTVKYKAKLRTISAAAAVALQTLLASLDRASDEQGRADGPQHGAKPFHYRNGPRTAQGTRHFALGPAIHRRPGPRRALRLTPRDQRLCHPARLTMARLQPTARAATAAPEHLGSLPAPAPAD
jgi:hypothetical protein